jgi:hypothetical protein
MFQLTISVLLTNHANLNLERLAFSFVFLFEIGTMLLLMGEQAWFRCISTACAHCQLCATFYCILVLFSLTITIECVYGGEQKNLITIIFSKCILNEK